jgi:hypothetical protein
VSEAYECDERIVRPLARKHAQTRKCDSVGSLTLAISLAALVLAVLVATVAAGCRVRWPRALIIVFRAAVCTPRRLLCTCIACVGRYSESRGDARLTAASRGAGETTNMAR